MAQHFAKPVDVRDALPDPASPQACMMVLILRRSPLVDRASPARSATRLLCVVPGSLGRASLTLPSTRDDVVDPPQGSLRTDWL